MNNSLSKEDVQNIIVEIDLTRDMFFRNFNFACSNLKKRLDVIDNLLDSKEKELRCHIDIVKRRKNQKKIKFKKQIDNQQPKTTTNVIESKHGNKNIAETSFDKKQKLDSTAEFTIPPEPDFMKNIIVPENFLT